MVGALDSVLRNVSKQLVDQFGKTVVQRRTIKGAYDELTGVTAADKVRDFNLNITPPSPFSAADRASSHTMKDAMIEAGDLSTFAAAKGIRSIPDEVTDVLIIDGETWTMVAVGKIYSGSLVTMYQLHLRR